MFTGIIEDVGTVTAVERSGDSMRVTVRSPRAVADAEHGDSICVSGVCLTVVEHDTVEFIADVMGETLQASTFAHLDAGTEVNLERAARVGDRLGGHIVQGHVDAVARLERIRDEDDWRVLRFALDADTARLVVEKGSVAVDGTSLTVSAVSPLPSEEGAVAGGPAGEADEPWFEVSLIPETLRATTLGSLRVGARVNVETDIIARHVERMLAGRSRA